MGRCIFKIGYQGSRLLLKEVHAKERRFFFFFCHLTQDKLTIALLE